jgi:hypothetical protein
MTLAVFPCASEKVFIELYYVLVFIVHVIGIPKERCSNVLLFGIMHAADVIVQCRRREGILALSFMRPTPSSSSSLSVSVSLSVMVPVNQAALAIQKCHVSCLTHSPTD